MFGSREVLCGEVVVVEVMPGHTTYNDGRG
jgi:hypothetical protein